MASTDRSEFLPNVEGGGQLRPPERAARALCSDHLANRERPLLGTAPAETTNWVLIEGSPWPANIEDHKTLGPELQRIRETTGITPYLIREPAQRLENGRPARSPRTGQFIVIVANSSPDQQWAEQFTLDDPSQLGDIDFSQVAGSPPGFGERIYEPIAAVCTHAKRDACCAVKGRPLAQELANAERPRSGPGAFRAYEISHIGGHALAGPGAPWVALPQGLHYSRTTPEQARAGLTAISKGEVPLPGLRGNSAYTAPGQIAHGLALRDLAQGADSVRASLTVTTDGPQATAATSMDSAQQLAWQVTTHTEESSARPLSCGGDDLPVKYTVVDSFAMTHGPADQLGPQEVSHQ